MNVRSRAARVANWARVIKIASVPVRERLIKKKPDKALPIADCRLPIERSFRYKPGQSKIGNQKSEMVYVSR